MMMWQKITLGSKIKELTDYTANGSFESLRVNVTYYHEHNFAALIRTTDLGKKLFNPERFTDEKGYKFLKKVHLKGKEILIANVGSLGKVYRVPEYNMPMVLAPNMYLVRFNEEVNEDFIYQYFISDFFKNSLLQKIGSTTLQAINKDNLRSIELKLPPKPEQTRIAEILSTADAAIAQTEALIAKYQRLKTGLMQDLLTRGIDANGNIRSKATHRFVVKKGIEVPEEWEVVRFENLFKTPLRDFGSFSMTNLIEFVNEGIPFIKSEIVFDNFIRYESISFITEKVHTLLFKSWVYPKNILLTKIGTIGRVAIYDGRLGIVNSNAATAKIDLNITKACPEFYSTYLQSEEVKRYFEENVISTPPRINLTEIKEMLVPLPALDEQERIAEKIQTINRILEQETTHLSKLHSLKTGLMQDLLSGRVRVKVNNG